MRQELKNSEGIGVSTSVHHDGEVVRGYFRTPNREAKNTSLVKLEYFFTPF